MITSYFTHEEFENEILKDYHLFSDFLVKRRKYLIELLKKSRDKSFTRAFSWKSPSNNQWWVVEMISNKNRTQSVTHGYKCCNYYYNGKLRVGVVNQEPDGDLGFYHYTYHFFNRVKERLNWKLSIEETAKKYLMANNHSFVWNQLEMMEDGECPMLGLSKLGMEFGFSREDMPEHCWYTTFIPIEMRKGDQFNIGEQLHKIVDEKLATYPESEQKEFKRLKESLTKVIEQYNNSSRFKEQKRKIRQGK
jgi:hypothetical protein